MGALGLHADEAYLLLKLLRLTWTLMSLNSGWTGIMEVELLLNPAFWSPLHCIAASVGGNVFCFWKYRKTRE